MLPKKAWILFVSLVCAAALLAGCWGGRGNSAAQTPSQSAGGGASSNSRSGGASGGMSGAAGGSSGSGFMGDLSEAIRDGMSGVTGSAPAGSASSGAGSGASASSGSGVASGVDDASSSSGSSSSGSASAAAAAAAPADGDAWMTRLVNAQNPLPENFSVETVNITGYDERLFDKRAAPDLEALLADAEAAGCKLYLVSGYRSVARQTALFRRKTNAFLAEGFNQDEAERQAAMWVARPGTSEHNTGLAADLVSADWYAHHSDLTADFDTTPEFEWLSAHCAEYGFILRYPEGKEKITGVTYEPWHYRYVGKQAAAEIMRAGGTLEEYVEGAAAPSLTEPWPGAAG